MNHEIRLLIELFLIWGGGTIQAIPA